MTPDFVADSSLEGVGLKATHLFSGPQPTSLVEVMRAAAKSGLDKTTPGFLAEAQIIANAKHLPALFTEAKGSSFSEVLTILETQIRSLRSKDDWTNALANPADVAIYIITGPKVNEATMKDAAHQLANFTNLQTGVTWEAKTYRKAHGQILMALGVVGRRSETVSPASAPPAR